MTDIDTRLSQVAGKLDDSKAALDATRAGLCEVIDAVAGGALTTRRLARSLADLDGLIARLRASASGLEGLDAAVGLTASEVREIRRQERERLHGHAGHEDGSPYLHAVGS